MSFSVYPCLIANLSFLLKEHRNIFYKNCILTRKNLKQNQQENHSSRKMSAIKRAITPIWTHWKEYKSYISIHEKVNIKNTVIFSELSKENVWMIIYVWITTDNRWAVRYKSNRQTDRCTVLHHGKYYWLRTGKQKPRIFISHVWTSM